MTVSPPTPQLLSHLPDHHELYRLNIGYLRITDFGIARVWREENAQDTSGTPGYMAPEVMCRQNHTTSVDFFAVGVMAYECMFGKVSTTIRSFCDTTYIFSAPT